MDFTAIKKIYSTISEKLSIWRPGAAAHPSPRAEDYKNMLEKILGNF